jgi:hypothetical protein
MTYGNDLRELPPEDSNLHQRFQRPLCCHYTRGHQPRTWPRQNDLAFAHGEKASPTQTRNQPWLLRRSSIDTAPYEPARDRPRPRPVSLHLPIRKRSVRGVRPDERLELGEPRVGGGLPFAQGGDLGAEPLHLGRPTTHHPRRRARDMPEAALPAAAAFRGKADALIAAVVEAGPAR